MCLKGDRRLWQLLVSMDITRALRMQRRLKEGMMEKANPLPYGDTPISPAFRIPGCSLCLQEHQEICIILFLWYQSFKIEALLSPCLVLSAGRWNPSRLPASSLPAQWWILLFLQPVRGSVCTEFCKEITLGNSAGIREDELSVVKVLQQFWSWSD